MNQCRVAIFVFLIACGSNEPPKAATVDVPPTPSASAPPALPAPSASAATAAPAGLPAPWNCDGGRGPTVKAPPPDNTPPPTAGQMTEAAAVAKRKFDGEKWKDAEIDLQHVVKGETGDDEGNKQLAEYKLAIVQYRLRKASEATASFRAIANRRSHLKHPETILWLSKIADEHPELLKLEDFATYTPEEVLRFNNDNQRGLYTSLSFLLGRERLAEGKDADAKRLLGLVPDEHPYAAAAKKCAALAK